MTKREQMQAAIAAQKKAATSPETDLSVAPPKPAPPPRERHPNDKLKARQRGHVQVGKGRLPDGSRFVAVYDADAQRWAGSLTMICDMNPVAFAADSKGVWRLMEKLDDLYRAHLTAQTPTPEAT